jgi:glucose-1-phosphate adenylyltransferase
VGPDVRLNSYSQISDSILFEGVQIGRHCRIRRAIIDKEVELPPGTEIGFDLEADRARGLTVTDNGVVVIAKGDAIEHLLTSENGARR